MPFLPAEDAKRIKEEKTMEHADDMLHLDRQLCFPLYAAARKIVNLYTPYFRPLGLTYTQYIVMMSLWETDPMKVGDLCRKLYLDSGTLTPLLKKLEAQGYLVRRRCREDERVVLCSLTEKGIALKEQVRSIPACVGRCVNLTPEEAATLYGLLYKLLGTLE